MACLASGPVAQSRILFGAYAVGWPLDKPGLRVLMVVPDTDEPWKRASVPFATSLASWSAVMLAATTALRRTVLPAPVAGVLLGSAAVVVDSLLTDMAEARAAAQTAESLVAADSAEPAEPVND